ncbi:MAG TPA: GAF domain-containing protein [Bryobacteraceae bacterium]|nr:GAF domain-containing protein [Bryobacteraceae bacterium]
MSTSPTLQATATGAAPERRASPRKSVIDRRLITVNLDDRDAGLMVDISEAGLAVQALGRIQQDATTSLQFELPDTATRIEATGRVAWADTTSGRAGISFDKLPENVAAALRGWVGIEEPVEETTDVPVSEPTMAAIATAVPAPLGRESNAAEIAALQSEINAQALGPDAALALTVERARSLTRSDGVAIVLGDSQQMTCRASSGSAPPVGADLRPESGLSGECARTGVTVRCEDTELDSRVDREACRALNIRSAVVVPLFARGKVSGLVEVFYSTARGFEGRDVLTLRRMADLISATLASPAAGELNPSTASESAYMAPTRALPSAPMIPPAPSVVICAHENPAAAQHCEKCGVPLPVALPSAAVLGSTLFQPPTADVRRWLKVRLKLSSRMIILIALLLMLVAIWGWTEYKSRHAPAVSPARTTSAIRAPHSAAPWAGYAG